MKTVETGGTEATKRDVEVTTNRARSGRARWRASRPTLVFILIWLSLDVLLNARYPGDEPAFWHLAPSVDLIVIFLCFSLGGQLDWRVPKVPRGCLVAWVFVIRYVKDDSLIIILGDHQPVADVNGLRLSSGR